LRSERGYPAANYDASAAKRAKSLRCRRGSFYDGKKVRNNNTTGKYFCPSCFPNSRSVRTTMISRGSLNRTAA
jgi:hypothetical protein